MRNEHAVTIARPPAAVFPYLTEPALLLRWVGGLREFVPVGGEEAHVGARSRQRMRIAGREWTFEGEVLDLDPDRRIVVRIAGSGLEMTTDYGLEAEDGGTRLTVAVETSVSNVLARVLGGLVEREGQRKLEADLARLAALVEGDGGAE